MTFTNSNGFTRQELLNFLGESPDPALVERIEAAMLEDEGLAAELERLAGSENFSRILGPDLNRPRYGGSALDRVVEKMKLGDFSPRSIEAEIRDLLDVPMEENRHGKIGKFEVRAFIAMGGTGLVFRGFDPDLQREVAIKALALAFADEPECRARFLREARAAAALEHPHMLPIYSVEDGKKTPFFVMPLLPTTCADFVKTKGPLRPRHAADLALQAASALAFAHREGIIHRDIKPSNLLLDETARKLYITDFSIAQTSSDGPFNSGSGTFGFAPPEQVAGQPATPQSDLYALGATLHFLATAALPGAPAAEESRRFPSWWRKLTNDLLQPEPGKRPVSADVVVRRLKRGCRAGLRRAFLATAVLAGSVVAAAAVSPIGISGWINRTLALAKHQPIYIEGRVATYGSLAHAIDASGGGTVILDFDGEFPLPAIDIWLPQGASLTLKAAPGRRPVLTQVSPRDAMITTRVPLTLDGITLLRPATGKPIATSLVKSITSSLNLRNCSVLVLGRTSPAEEAPIAVFGVSPEVEVTDCLILAGTRPWMLRRAVRMNPVQPTNFSNLSVVNTAIAGGYLLFQGSESVTLALRLENSALRVKHIAQAYTSGTVHVVAMNSGFFLSGEPLPAIPRFQPKLRWQGQSNRYAMPGSGFEEWLKVLGVEEVSPVRIPAPEYEPKATAIEDVEVALRKLRSQIP